MPPVDNSDVTAARQGVLMMQKYMPPVDTSGLTIEDRTIPGPGGALPIRIYQPETATRPAPALLFFHWGGFMLGDLDTEHARCVMLALEAECVVVSVDYRLAPEHPFPAAPEDCYASLLWTAKNANELGINSACIAVGGTSAGGGLAAAICLMAKDRNGPQIVFQLMGFPVVDHDMKMASVQAFTDTPNWTYDATINMWKYYLGEASKDMLAYAAPLHASDLSQLPPAYIWTGEFDPLRDEGIAYAERLMAAGVPVELHNYAGAFHGFDQVPDASIAARSRKEQVAALRAAFNQPGVDDNTEQVTHFGHTMIHVADVEVAVAWYRKVFGFKVKFMTDDKAYAELSSGTTTLAFSVNDLEKSKYGVFNENDLTKLPGGFHLTFEVKDLDSVYKSALDNGAVNISEPQAQPWGARVARLRDPNGVLLAIGGL
ncbi:MAG: alpha/beta hydrolase fold domain-containing protein [Deinococcota bacterium]